MGFFQNTAKPEGFTGKMMVRMMNKGHSPLAKWGYTHFVIPRDGNILDIGCGGGANLRQLLLKSQRGKVTGIDYSDISVATSTKVNQTEIESGRCRVIHGSVESLPFDDDNFELITAFETIYFWPDIQENFYEVYRVLKKGGTFMICNEGDGETHKDDKWVEKIDGMNLYRINQLKGYLENAGFSDIKIDNNDKHWVCFVCKK